VGKRIAGFIKLKGLGIEAGRKDLMKIGILD